MRLLTAIAAVLLVFVAGCGKSKKAGTGKTKKVAKKKEPRGKTRPKTRPKTEPVGRTAGVPTHFLGAGKANIVYTAEDTGSGLHAVEIWVSKDGGKNWEKYATDKAMTGKVLYEVKDEGTFEFTSLGVDKIGNREKELNAATRPDFRIVVDRTAPKVTATAPTQGKLALAGAAITYSWSAEDPYLAVDPVELQVKFKKNPVWVTVARGLPAKGKDKFKLPAADDDVAEVRFVARDRSGNVGQSGAGAVAFDLVAPVGKILGPRTATDLIAKVQYTVSDPGAAKLVAVSLWITENGGRSWRKVSDAPPKSGEIEIRLPRAGAYGLALSAADSVGNQLPPPRRGTRPRFTIATDTVPPKLETLGWVRRGQVVSSKKGVELKWKSTDHNLGKTPVSIEFSANGGRTWETVGARFAPTGSFSFKPSNKLNSRRCLLRLVARDHLGNESKVTSKPFIVDNVPPKTSAALETIKEEPKKKIKEKKKEKKRGRRR